jgi:pre-mRNA-processing factor 39
MGDSETVVSETSAAMGYEPASYTSTGYTDASSNVVPNTDASTEAAGDFAASAAQADANSTVRGGSDLVDGNVYGTEPNPVMQEAHVNTTFETEPAVSSEKVTDPENAATKLSQIAGTNYSVNASVGEAGNLAVENGNASDNVGRAVDEQQFDGFGVFFFPLQFLLC